MLAERFGLGPADTCYLSMPLFHSNAIMAGWAVRRWQRARQSRCAASSPRRQFLPDVRRFGATYANYVGKPLSYILATPRAADDADNPLRVAYGNEGRPADLDRFARRFGVQVVDGFGSTEGGVAIARTPDTPDGALGPLVDGVDHRRRRHRASHARPGVVGELVNTAGRGQFRGYYKDAAAEAERMARRCLPQRRPGLPRRARLRVLRRAARRLDAGRRREPRHGTDRTDPDALPRRHRGRGVPDSRPGRRRPGDGGAGAPGRAPRSTRTSSANSSPGSPISGPSSGRSFVRVGTALPRTETFKIVKRQLSAEGTDCADPVYEIARPARNAPA